MRKSDWEALSKTDLPFDCYDVTSAADLEGRGDSGHSARDLREMRELMVDRMEDLQERVEGEQRDYKAEEERLFDALERGVKEMDRRIRKADEAVQNVRVGDSHVPGTNDDGRRWVNPKTGREVRVYGPEERIGSSLDPSSEYSDLRFGAYMRAMITGPRNEVERRALTEGTDSQGGYTVPNVLSGRILDALASKSVCRRAGAQIVPLQSDNLTIAAVDTLPSGSWRDEGQAVTVDSSMTFRSVEFAPKSYAIIVKATRELVEDSDSVEDAIEQAFSQKLSVVADEAALVGAGASDPEGIANFGNVNSVSHNNRMSDWSAYGNIIELIQKDNAPSEVDTAIMHPAVWKQHTNLFTDTTGQPLRRPSNLEALNLMQTTGVTATKEIVGNFRHLLMGMRVPMRVEVLKDLYAQSDLSYGFLCYMRMDVQAEYEQQFGVIDSITT